MGGGVTRLLRSPFQPPNAPWRHDFLIEHRQLPNGSDQIPTLCAVRDDSLQPEGYLYVSYATGEEELYDLRRDTYELSNLAGDPADAATLDALRRRLDQLCVPAPPGMIGPSRALPVSATIAVPLLTAAGFVAVRRRRPRPE